MERVLSGEAGPLGDAVALNAAGALLAGGAVQELKAGVLKALELLRSGEPLAKLRALAEVSQSAAEA